MTLWDLLEAARRRWYVALAGTGITLLLAMVVARVPGVYHTQVDVVFMWPQTHQSANTFQYGSQSLIKTAGVVARIVGSSQSGAQPVSDTVTLVGEGVTHGYSVRLPNAGGQWAINFDQPLLDVQASGSSPQEVRDTVAGVVDRINAALRAQQIAEGVRPDLMITTRMSPPTPPIMYSKGSRVRALAATVLPGTGLTLAVAVAYDRRRRRRTERLPPVRELATVS